jgi:F0F1-type ATP synthase assembly protein I
VKTVGSIIGLQIAATAVSGVVVGATTRDLGATVSALWGGSIGFLSAATYAIAMRAPRGSGPDDLLRAQYRAQGLKFAVTLGLFGITFAIAKDVSPLPLLLTYCLTLLAYWAALLRNQDES